MGHLINRHKQIFRRRYKQNRQTYHNWRAADHVIASEAKQSHAYKDIKGFCKSATVGDVAALDYVLTPGHYVGLPDDEDDFDFNERFSKLTAEMKEQMPEGERLNAQMPENLGKIELKQNA